MQERGGLTLVFASMRIMAINELPVPALARSSLLTAIGGWQQPLTFENNTSPARAGGEFRSLAVKTGWPWVLSNAFISTALLSLLQHGQMAKSGGPAVSCGESTREADPTQK